MRLDLPLHPTQHLKTSIQTDKYGNLYAVVSNPTAIGIGRIQLKVLQLDVNTGRVVGRSEPLFILGIESGKRAEVQVAGVRIISPQDLRLYKVQIESVFVVR